MIELGTDEHLTAAGWIFFIVLIAIAAVAVIVPIVTVVNWRRAKDGKVSKGKVRNIVIVYKRVTEHVYFNEDYGFWRTRRPENTESSPAGIAQETSVDFRKVGGRVLYTKSIDDELFDRLEVGRTYKVRIRDGAIVSIDNV